MTARRRPDLYPAPRVEFGLTLRRLREDAGLEQQDLAGLVNLTSDSLSRFELGKRNVKRHHVEAVARALSLDEEAAADLLEQFTEADTLDKILKSTAPYRPKKAQEDRNKMLADATRVHSFAVTEIPFFLQDLEYARQEVGDIPDARQVADLRTTAGQEVGKVGKEFKIVLSEAALRFLPCDTRAMRNQLSHLRGMAGKPGITLGIIPFGKPLTTPLKNAFTVFDENTVIDTYGGELQLTPKQASRYVDFLGRLADDAAYGDEALALLTAAIDALPNP